MLIALMCWIGFSTIFCLAFLLVAARPMPKDEQMAEVESQLELQHEHLQTAKGMAIGARGQMPAMPESCQVI